MDWISKVKTSRKKQSHHLLFQEEDSHMYLIRSDLFETTPIEQDEKVLKCQLIAHPDDMSLENRVMPRMVNPLKIRNN